MYSPLGSETQ